MPPAFDWNDLKVFLAVARLGTTLGAARLLGVSQSTAARRVLAMEAALGIELFVKRQAGYALTEAGAALLGDAEAIESRIAAFVADAAAARRGVSGTVRLSTNELLANRYMLAAMRAFRAVQPGITVELDASDRVVDLGGGEADIAIRAGRAPTEADLAGRKIAPDGWSFYASRDYVAARGLPRAPAELAGHAVIGIDASRLVEPFGAAYRSVVRDGAVVMRQNNATALLGSIKAGLGIGAMSDFVAAGDPDLVRCFPMPLPFETAIWLLTPLRLQKEPRIRAVMDFFAGYFSSGRHLEG